MAAAKKQCFFVFLYWTESSPIINQSPRFTNYYKFGISVNTYISSRHSNLSFAHHFVIYWLFQNGRNKKQHQESHQRETIPDKFVFFSKLVRQEKSIGWAKYMYVCEWDMCLRIFCNFSWWLNIWKVGQKQPFFQMSAILKFDFQKKKTIRPTFFRSKLSKLHKKYPIFHVTTTFSPKTRGSKNKQWTHITPLTLKVQYIRWIYKINYPQKSQLFHIYMKKVPATSNHCKIVLDFPAEFKASRVPGLSFFTHSLKIFTFMIYDKGRKRMFVLKACLLEILSILLVLTDLELHVYCL